MHPIPTHLSVDTMMYTVQNVQEVEKVENKIVLFWILSPIEELKCTFKN